jgi:hypothetical protein
MVAWFLQLSTPPPGTDLEPRTRVALRCGADDEQQIHFPTHTLKQIKSPMGKIF